MRRLPSALGLLAVLLLLPFGLLYTAGPPFVPNLDQSGAREVLRGQYIQVDSVIRGLGLICWVVWAYLLLVILLRIAARAVERANPRAGAVIRSASDAVTPRWIRRALDLALSGTLVFSAVSGVAHSQPDRSHVLAVATIAEPNHAYPAVFDPEYVIKPGDSLWDIAERQLGSGYRWREIYELNRGRMFSDGRILVNPRMIHPGWVLTMPEVKAQAVSPPPPPPQASSPQAPTVPKEATDHARPPTTRQQELSSAPKEVRPVIELPSGGALTASFASGLLAAQALSALRRRRNRKALAEPDDFAEPSLVLDLRRSVEVPAAGHLEAAATEVAALWQRVNPSLPRFPIALEEKDQAILYLSKADEGTPVIPPSTSRIVFRDEGQVIRAEVNRPFPAKPVRQETLPATGMFLQVGARRGTAVHLGVLATGGLSVTGSRAGSFAAQAVLSCAADTACEDLEVYMIGDDPALVDLRNLNHIRATASWQSPDDALQRVQREILRRARVLTDEGVEDIWSYYAADREDPLFSVLIVMTRPPQGMAGIAEAISAQGRNLGVGVIAVGWVSGAFSISLEVEKKVRLKKALPGVPEHLAPLHLSPGEISQAVEIINSARSPAWDTDLPEERIVELGDEHHEAEVVILEDPVPGPAQPEPPKIVVSHEPSVFTDEIALNPYQRQLQARTFGDFVIIKDGRIVEKGLRTAAREVVALLVAHPQGISKERIWDLLWPEADTGTARLDLNKTLYNLRQRMGKDAEHVTRTRGNCMLNFETWWADAVAFESQLSRAGSLAAEDAIEALSGALDLYNGPFCNDCYFTWLEPIRDRYKSMFVKSSARLANLLMEYDRADEAIATLDRAIEVDIVNEDLYRRALAIEGRLGRRKAVQQRFSKLGAILQDELDVDPDDETATLFRKLMSDLEKERRVVRPS